MIFDYISLPVFLSSFAIGLFFVYILGPEIKTVHIYPTPENIHQMLFKDKANNCFQFEETIVDCPSDESMLSTVPIQS
jgi:hypothetical protein